MKLKKIAVSEEGFIFDPETGNSFTVSSTGLFILERLKKGMSLDEILRALLDEFEVDEETARKDLADFVQQLRLLGLWEDGKR